jgi:hypothetical protein
MPDPPPEYGVFVNCPFDESYQVLGVTLRGLYERDTRLATEIQKLRMRMQN